MSKLKIIFGVSLLLGLATLAYAGTSNPCVVIKAEGKRQICKTSQKLIPEKLLKIKSIPEFKSIDKPSSNPVLKASSADTFEAIIAPFLKAVSPHFYDQIIRKEPRSATVAQS